MAKAKISTKGITRRWMINGLAVIVMVLFIFEVAFLVAIRFYSYDAVENALYTRANAQSTLLKQDMQSSTLDFSSRAREMVEGFVDKEKMELQIVDNSGRIVVSSTGFSPRRSDDAPEDYRKALKDPSGKGVWCGKGSGDESVMAMSLLVRNSGGEIMGALRYVVSLTLVNQQIILVLVITLIVGALIIFFMILSSSYFVSSIVTPVMEIGSAARRIALGDYDSRIEKKYDDEIGDLCDTINYMAGEISAAEQMKNDFISSVSHELRTPLTAIKGWSETLRQAGPEEAELTTKGLDVIAGEAERLSGIVEELLDFSRMQSGRMTMKFERIDILAELEEAVFLFRERAQREGLSLEYVESPALPPVLGDRDRLKQVFINIIDNAIKYSNNGGRVRIEAADMGEHVQIVVSDSGVGIAPEDLPNVKERFYKANKTRPGSGIGLALADEIIRRHKGRLDIDSEINVGTTVTITLPVAPSDAR